MKCGPRPGISVLEYMLLPGVSSKTTLGGRRLATRCMQLQMKSRCEKCGARLLRNGEVYICSYECTFCPSCNLQMEGACPNCGGELVRRPRRSSSISPVEDSDFTDSEFTDLEFMDPWSNRPWLIWAASFGIWSLVAVAGSGSIYELYRARGYPMTFGSVLGMEFSQVLTYAPLTPFAFALAMRFPVQTGNWARRLWLHLLFGVIFSIAHTTLRGVTPYAAWDPKLGGFVSAIWNSQAHAFQIKWNVFRNLFLSNLVDDITGTYIPIVLVAHAIAYYRRFRDRELHSAKLETQLTKSHLQALKSHLQPHFLFNTMHSISALMLTDVKAADKMMSRLSDLLRMSLANNGIQMTSLSRELEFVDAYLEVEKLRLGDRLKVDCHIAEETLDAQVPSLLLQPLVENAIIHGVSRLSAGGNIWITASHEGSDLCLRIADNGPGLDPNAKAPFKTGLGLGSTRERLQTLYGANQTLDIHAAPEGGVEVCVKIPFRVELEASDEAALAMPVNAE